MNHNNIEDTSLIPTIAIFEENNKVKTRKRIKQNIDYEKINFEKRLSFALIFSILLFALLYHKNISTTFIGNIFTEVADIIYEISNLGTGFETISFLGITVMIITYIITEISIVFYFVFIAALSTSKKIKTRKIAIIITCITIAIHFFITITLQFTTFTTSVIDYLLLITLIIWCSAQIALLKIKREGIEIE